MIKTLVTGLLLLALVSCSTKPAPFEAGKDQCDFCRMGITDLRYGGELISKKGKIFKFDDLHCLAGFLKDGKLAEKDIASSLAINFEKPNTFLETGKAVFVVSPDLMSPMGSHAAGFVSKEAATLFSKEKTEAEIMDWPALLKKLQ